MKYRPKFKKPESREEVLICALVKRLHDTVEEYIKDKRGHCSDSEIFITIRDGVLAFAGQQIEALTNVMADNLQKPVFLKECQTIIGQYLQQTFETMK